MTQRANHFLIFNRVICSYSGVFLPAQPVSLYVDEGECVGITGPESSKLSLLLTLAAGLVPQNSGEILIDGTSVTDSAMTIGCLVRPYFFSEFSGLPDPLHTNTASGSEKQLFLVNHKTSSYCRMSFSRAKDDTGQNQLISDLLSQAELILLEDPFDESGKNCPELVSFEKFHTEGRTVLFSYSNHAATAAGKFAGRRIVLPELTEQSGRNLIFRK